jgi:uncharacterized protein (DUF4415 family)
MERRRYEDGVSTSSGNAADCGTEASGGGAGQDAGERDRYLRYTARAEEAWKNAVRGRLYRPVKQAVSLRLDADVVAWLKKDGEGYPTRANQMLRERMLQDVR